MKLFASSATVHSATVRSAKARSVIVPLALVFALAALVSSSPAQSATHLDKHARKIHHKLAKFPSGQYLHLVLSDNSNSYGALGELSENTFTFTNADSNSTSTYSYNDVDKVRTDKEPIGQGAEPRHHIRHLVPIAVSLAAVGAAGAVYAAER